MGGGWWVEDEGGTFVGGAVDAFHYRAPVHDVFVGGAKLQQLVAGVALIRLQLRHEPLGGRRAA